MFGITIDTKIRRDFSRAAKTYDNYAVLQRIVAEKLFLDFKLSIDGVGILDLGCGTGYFHELLRKNKIYVPLVQLDISHSMSKTADIYSSSPEYGGTYTCTADMHSLPFADASFSDIFSSMTLQWASGLGQVFLEAKRVLQDEGNFAFSIVADGSLFELKEVFAAMGEKPPVHKFVTQSELETELEKSGFSIQEIHSEPIFMFYKDIYAMLLSIKGVGASYKGTREGGIKGKNYFVKMEKIYRDNFVHNEGLPLSWNIIYVRCGK